MANRTAQLQSGTSTLRPAFPEAVDFQVDSVDHKWKYLGDDGIIHSLVTEDLSVAPVTLTATGALTAVGQANRPIVYNNAAGGTLTLPAATGSGAKFWIFIGTTLTSGSFVVNVANSADYMRGAAYTVSAGTASTFPTSNTGTVSTESDTITFNRTTTGLGTIGDFIEAIDIAPHVWSVECDYASSGTAATPFTAAV